VAGGRFVTSGLFMAGRRFVVRDNAGHVGTSFGFLAAFLTPGQT
jgi:hypothetical protein